jgi:hypothetical protein
MAAHAGKDVAAAGTRQGAGTAVGGARKFFTKAAKVLEPLGLALEVGTGVKHILDAKPEEKGRVAAEEAGGFVGGRALGYAGAVIGTMIFPGVGTVVGGFLGSLAGRFGGRAAAGAVAKRLL